MKLVGPLLVVIAVAAGCGQSSADQGPPTLNPGGNSGPAAASEVRLSPETPSPSPIPSGPPAYATPSDAGVAAIEPVVLGMYTGGNCLTSQAVPCLGAPYAFASATAAEVTMDYFTVAGSPAISKCYAYVYFDTAWHYTPSVVCTAPGAGFFPELGKNDLVFVDSGCANVRQAPSLAAKVVACMKNRTQVSIDNQPPVYAQGHIWWSINGHLGWMAHDFLIQGYIAIGS